MRAGEKPGFLLIEITVPVGPQFEVHPFRFAQGIFRRFQGIPGKGVAVRIDQSHAFVRKPAVDHFGFSFILWVEILVVFGIDD